MLTYENNLSARNRLTISLMGTPEQLTVGDRGTPQLLQTENVDSMHPHDTVMALEFRDTVMFGSRADQSLTFLFAPRGEAAVGPVPFMHRESAEGNPDAPLGHALQDAFHDVSTVVGLEYQVARTTLEVTAFSGNSISWPFPLHGLDSYGIRLNQDLGGHVRVGASYADALLPDDAGRAEHNQFISAWLSTTHRRGGDTLRTAFIWGRARSGRDSALNSVLEEAVYRRGANSFFGRAELLQIRPSQLEVTLPGGGDSAGWASAITVGYERSLIDRDGLRLFIGGSYTRDFVPAAFESAYASDPSGVKLYVRFAFMNQSDGF